MRGQKARRRDRRGEGRSAGVTLRLEMRVQKLLGIDAWILGGMTSEQGEKLNIPRAVFVSVRFLHSVFERAL